MVTQIVNPFIVTYYHDVNIVISKDFVLDGAFDTLYSFVEDYIHRKNIRHIDTYTRSGYYVAMWLGNWRGINDIEQLPVLRSDNKNKYYIYTYEANSEAKARGFAHWLKKEGIVE